MAENDVPVGDGDDVRSRRGRLQARLAAGGSSDVGLPVALQALCRLGVEAASVSGAAVSLMTLVPSRGVLSGAVVAASDERPAKGAVASLAGVSVDEAFALMRARARADRTRLADVARSVLDATATDFPSLKA